MAEGRSARTGPGLAADTAARSAPDKGCDGAETLFAGMRATAIDWDPEQDPFAPTVAAAVRNVAIDLADTRSDAAPGPVRSQFAANINALNLLGAAMGGHDAARVLDAVTQVRVAYSALNAACDPTRTAALAPTSTPSSDPPSPTPTRTPEPLSRVCVEVQRLMAKVSVELGSASWSSEAHPFDASALAKWDAFADQLATLAPQGGTAVQPAIAENAGAFAAIADAMRARHRSRVYDAMGEAQLAYAHLQADCRLP